MSEGPVIGIVMGSASDMPVMSRAAEVLRDMGIRYEMKVCSAHRLPEITAEYARTARDRGLEVIIAGAGMAAHLAGSIAAYSTLPVIGVPIKSGELNGMDALLSTVQMPSGIPVATVAINGAANGAFLAAAILSIKYPEVRGILDAYRLKAKKLLLEKIDHFAPYGGRCEGLDNSYD
ncbi:MAG: 5-(carboxyamino)imidazole ribonucleotide mutase [Nitrospirae bacterium]|nr:5-(carboxyamino)imidazole ribonucleotide mutase [Nitrospirota bacterium]MBF0590558.1 5-(carboxyamino)imidazole ribonucleotide mutase [Nitrospirota bacterium]